MQNGKPGNNTSLNIYKDKRVLITGHTGFKGSWLSLWLDHLGAEVAGYSLLPDKLSHFNLLDLKTKNYFLNINDYDSLLKSFIDFKPDIIFHLAAQPLVRSSYEDPIETYNTNVLGSLKVYKAALDSNVKALVSITTDKVYENKEWVWPYRENDSLGGHDPYSSSKACVEILSQSFQRSFLNNGEMLMSTARAGNVIGGGDWAKDRLIPDLVKNANLLTNSSIRNPSSIRPWQHVLEPLHGYLILGTKLLLKDKAFCTSFNFGPYSEDSQSVKDVCLKSSSIWKNIQFNFPDKHNGPHEASVLRLDISKSIELLNWLPVWSTDVAIEKTILWYKNFYEKSEIISKDQLIEFISQSNKLSRN